MKKIRLDLDALKVESFVTNEGTTPGEGTVFAMAATDCGDTCQPIGTCALGCQASEGCFYTNPGAMTCTGATEGTCVPDTYFCPPPTYASGCGGGGTEDPFEETCDGEECLPEVEGGGV